MDTKTILSTGGAVVALALGSVKGLDWLDSRYDTRYASASSVETKMDSYSSKTQISLLDIQIMIVQGHIRDLDSMKERRALSSQEQRDLRLEEVRLSALQKERREILGSPE